MPAAGRTGTLVRVEPLANHPLEQLHNRPLGPHRLRLARLRPAEKSGWTRFHLLVAGRQGDFEPAVVQGLHSRGGRGVLPWIEVLAYEPSLRRPEEALNLPEQGWDVQLFSALGELIPPGGHLMVGCETPPHQETYQALMKQVPPVATPLGAALFRAGFRKVKFFYLAEGGWEGQQKLWAEKPMNAEMRREWDAATARDLKAFLATPHLAPAAAPCLPRAQAILRELESAL